MGNEIEIISMVLTCVFLILVAVSMILGRKQNNKPVKKK